MLTSNLCTPVGLHNGSRGKVLDFVYMSSEAVAVKFIHLDPEMPAFL